MSAQPQPPAEADTHPNADGLFDVVFRGECVPPASPEAVRQALQAMFKLDDTKAAGLMGGRRIIIKRAVDRKTALRFEAAFREAGARVELEPLRETETIVAAPPPPLRDDAAATGTPRQGGSIPGTVAAPRSAGQAGTAPAGTIDTGALTLAPVGTQLDEIDDRGPPQHPDISALSLVLDPNWTLEDCTPPPPEVPVPSTEALSLEPLSEPGPRPETQARNS